MFRAQRERPDKMAAAIRHFQEQQKFLHKWLSDACLCSAIIEHLESMSSREIAEITTNSFNTLVGHR